MNRFESFFKPLMWFMAIMMAAVVAGCGGGGGGGSAAAPAAAAAPIGDVSGVWAVVESDVTSPAPECMTPGNPPVNYPLTVAQDTPATNAITVTDASNPDTSTNFSGTINGNKLSWSGSFKERGGTTTYNSVDLTVGTDCNALAGTTTWTYVQDAPATFSCTGKTTLSATKNGGATCTPPPASGS